MFLVVKIASSFAKDYTNNFFNELRSAKGTKSE
jgi:hypothetical protein